MTERVDCVVVGAGVVGLAVARACTRAGVETLVLEAAGAIGTGISSRNSEVIHAGLYYPPGSLKARLCVAGRQRLYAYCDAHHVPCRRCGKLVVATSDGQQDALRRIAANANASGVTNLRWLSAREARALEPALHCSAAIESPSTGIVASHAFMRSLQGELEAGGGMLALASPVLGGEVMRDGSGIRLRVGGSEPVEILARRAINCAGLNAQAVARSIRGVPAASIPAQYYAKGSYYALSARPPFSRLIYPLPDADSLGVHLTLDLAGRARFGPDVECVGAPDYDVDPARADGFYAAIRRYWPALADGALHPDYAGVRPKLGPAGAPAADFVIQGPEAHGVHGLIQLYGIESPGLTASLAIADEVVARLGRNLHP